MIMTVTGSGYILMLCSLFNLSITPVCILPALIADEKDKGTLITLYRAGVHKKQTNIEMSPSLVNKTASFSL